MRPLTIAEVQKKYDVEFRQMCREMLAELNEAVKTDTVAELTVDFEVNTITRSDVRRPGVISAVVLLDAGIKTSVKYQG